MSKGRINVVHLYPREMSIYGDLGNTRCLASRLRWHGYEAVVAPHHPGEDLPEDAAPARRRRRPGQRPGPGRGRPGPQRRRVLKDLAADGAPMLMICGMYQLFGNAFVTVEGRRLPGLGILDVTTQGNAKRMIGPVVLDTAYGDVVGYENHSGSTLLGEGQQPFGTVRSGLGNNGNDRTEGAVTGSVFGSYLHGPILPANPTFADALIALAVRRATGREFEPAEVDDSVADQARLRQVRRLAG